MSENNENKGGMIVLLIFLLICSGLGIAAFTMSFTKKCGEGFVSCNKGHNNPCRISSDNAENYNLPPKLCMNNKKNGEFIDYSTCPFDSKDRGAIIYCTSSSCRRDIKEQLKTELINSSENIKKTFPECTEQVGTEQVEYSLPQSYVEDHLCLGDHHGTACKQLRKNSKCSGH